MVDKDYVKSMECWIAQRELSIEAGKRDIKHIEFQIELSKKMIKALVDQITHDQNSISSQRSIIENYIKQHE